MACRTGCPFPGSHSSWGECARAANVKVAYCGIGGGDYTKQKKWDAEIKAYRSARAEGIKPSGTTMPKIEAARKMSDKTGTAWTDPR